MSVLYVWTVTVLSNWNCPVILQFLNQRFLNRALKKCSVYQSINLRHSLIVTLPVIVNFPWLNHLLLINLLDSSLHQNKI